MTRRAAQFPGTQKYVTVLPTIASEDLQEHGLPTQQSGDRIINCSELRDKLDKI
jgi:hypothetical protein